MTDAPQQRTGGVLFDMDGTLIDSEPIWHRTMIDYATSQGAEWTQEDCDETTGAPMETWAAKMSERGVPGTVAEIVDAVAGRVAETVSHNVPWLPGARELLEALGERGVPTALVTNASRVNADAMLRAAPAGTLSVAVSADDVTNGKPDPEPYLTGARLLDVDPEQSIFFEDSVPGSTSGRQAGATLWFVTTHTAADEVDAEHAVSTLADVDVEAVLDALHTLASPEASE